MDGRTMSPRLSGQHCRRIVAPLDTLFVSYIRGPNYSILSFVPWPGSFHFSCRTEEEEREKEREMLYTYIRIEREKETRRM